MYAYSYSGTNIKSFSGPESYINSLFEVFSVLDFVYKSKATLPIHCITVVTLYRLILITVLLAVCSV
jgi:hypothetical protein